MFWYQKKKCLKRKGGKTDECIFFRVNKKQYKNLSDNKSLARAKTRCARKTSNT